MNKPISSYAILGDLRTATLVSKTGSMDWLCWPDFDSEAVFASLVGTDQNGTWQLAPHSWKAVSRRYLPGTLVLETTYTRAFGSSVVVTEFMPVKQQGSSIVRIVHCVKGRMRMQMRFAPRLDYGSARPRITHEGQGCWHAVYGPLRLVLRSNVPLKLESGDLTSDWHMKEGDRYVFTLQHSHSFIEEEPHALDTDQLLRLTTEHWQEWSSHTAYDGQYKVEVNRSLLTLKALTYAASGGYVAAPTTSLPEKIGGIRNWDYRFCWLRDTTFSLLGLLHCGHREEAEAWLQWLSRSVQGDPATLKTLYGISGKREHSEWKAGWLSGYMGSTPVHIGNNASAQLQLDTFGEVMDVLYRARCHGIYPREDKTGESLEVPLLRHLESVWQDPDAGLWEMRSDNQHFTQSKVMAWVAFDRGIRMIEKFGMSGPLERWRNIRSRIHAQVCKRGFHAGMNSFTQAYGTRHMDASLLMLPLVGFLPVQDHRIVGTVKAIEKHLMRDGLLLRYDTARVRDGLPAGEGAFLACNFWLVDVYVLQGKMGKARAFFEKLLALSNNVGLLSEEYDSKHGLVGNFPQAFSHIGLINSALSLDYGHPVRLHGLE